jgi:hypothetical protein
MLTPKMMLLIMPLVALRLLDCRPSVASDAPATVTPSAVGAPAAAHTPFFSRLLLLLLLLLLLTHTSAAAAAAPADDSALDHPQAASTPYQPQQHQTLHPTSLPPLPHSHPSNHHHSTRPDPLPTYSHQN